MQEISDGKLMNDSELRAWGRGYRIACVVIKNMLLEHNSRRDLKDIFDEIDRMVTDARMNEETHFE